MLVPLLAALLLQSPVQATPDEDRAAFAAFFQARFPDVPFAEFANGIYAIDMDARQQWLDIEAFPPYEFAVEAGQALWEQTFPGGGSYSDCFPGPIREIRPSYPYFDRETSRIVTMELAINECRESKGVARLTYDSRDMLELTAYLAFRARGEKLDIHLPADEPQALEAYEAGKRFYYTKRGQLNFACYDCHITSVGQYVRADRLGPSLGHPTHFPVYRSKLGAMLSLHQRFAGCVRDVGAKPFELQSEEYRNLEYFLSYMSNGLEWNGPGARK
jgi:sulfur-oxidizing protein SoxA